LLNINIVNAFEDNYIFMLTCDVTGEVAVVDPGDAAVVMDFLGDQKLAKIFITHHHHDHIGGVEKLVEKYGCDVIAFKGDQNRIPCITATVGEGDKVQVGHAQASVMSIPGHTTGHIGYYFADEKALFCGDTLFVAGCGRLFEGTADIMFNSMVKLNLLPDDTAVYCAHEYTLANLNFATHVAPDDIKIKESLKLASKKRQARKATVPSTIGVEKEHNVFLKAKTVQEFARFRQLKDNF
jgi:hydroxyacylglutathione hydrolase